MLRRSYPAGLASVALGRRAGRFSIVFLARDREKSHFWRLWHWHRKALPRKVSDARERTEGHDPPLTVSR